MENHTQIPVHYIKCKGQSSSQQNETASTSEIQFVDCGETIKQEIKEESDTADEINTLDDPLTVNSEHCQDIVVSSEISLESELEAESIDCKETIKLEIKQETQETTEDLLISFLLKILFLLMLRMNPLL